MTASDHAKFSDSVVIGGDDRISNWTALASRASPLHPRRLGRPGRSSLRGRRRGVPHRGLPVPPPLRGSLGAWPTAANDANKVTDEDAGKSEAQ